MITQASELICRTALSGIDSTLIDFNSSVIDGRKITFAQLIPQVTTPPFFAERRVVRLLEATILTKKKTDGDSISGEEKTDRPTDNADKYFAQLVVDMPKTTTLIVEVASLDKRRAMSKFMLENAQCYEFNNLLPREAESWIRDRVKKLGMNIDNRAVTKMIDMCGVSMRALRSELDKMCAYLDYKGTI
ncbi:MAG: hypothetical protein Q8N36_05350, partial [bacterium]|nr:hypothetical protein [bacterium]